MADLRPLSEVVSAASGQPRFTTLVMSFFRMTKAIFEHLVITRRDALDAGICDIESLWEYFYTAIQEAAMSFLDMVEEEMERRW